MGRDLRGSRVLITGASRGIGRCLAEQVARGGARVVLAARTAGPLEELAGSLQAQGAEAVAVPADVTVEADRQHLLDVAALRFGGLDVLINNAGVGGFGHFATGTEALLRQVMEVDFFAPAELMRLALPLLKEGREPAIVNVASMCGRRGIPAWSEYSGAKFGLVGLSEALRAEFARFDIDVLVVLPGLTRSEFSRSLLRNDGRMKIEFDQGMPPQDVAAGILGALRARRRETVLGWEARWILRFNRFFPGLVNWLMARRVRKLYAESGERRVES
jgi:short-subunit dehydrogenase